MEKIWLASYPPGVPPEIDLDEFSSLVDLFLTSAEKHAARPAFANTGASITFAELERASRAFAAYLQTEVGLAKGDRLAIMMPNVLAYPVALFGALRAGAVVVNVNPLYTARELREQLADSGASTIVVLENFGHVLAECIAQTPVENVIVARIGDLLGSPKGALVNFVVKHVKRLVPAYALPGAVAFGEALARGERHALAPVPLGQDDLALLQYTGGTTGAAKGAMLTHGNMVANVQQATAWMAPVVEEGAETVITALPLYHIFALTANCLSFVKIGGLNVLITNPRDLRAFVKELARVRFTAITGVNTLFNALLNTPGFASLDFGALKMALGGGMAVQRSVAERWKEVTGVALVEAYGLTETAPAVCINPLDAKEFSGSIGLPMSSTECMVRGEDGSALGVGEVGELCVRGPQVMKGYWQRPEETAKCLDADGWLATGDVARIDERGYVYLVDRKKDVIIVSGFNVFPNEIEEVISAHPDVLEVGAIGVADEHSGEVVKVVVVKRNPGLTREALEAYCRDNLAGYKRPKLFEFTSELPKSNVGKILRRELRERFGGAD